MAPCKITTDNFDLRYHFGFRYCNSRVLKFDSKGKLLQEMDLKNVGKCAATYILLLSIVAKKALPKNFLDYVLTCFILLISISRSKFQL